MSRAGGQLHTAAQDIATGVDDETLVAGALAGRPHDFEMLVERHQRTVYALAHRWLGDPMAADDVTQATFVQAHAHLGDFGGRSAFRTWLCGIALNQARSWRRQRRREHAVPLDDVPERDLPAAPEASRDSALGRTLRRLSERLPARQRSVLALRLETDLPWKEIARLEGITENAAKVNYHHAITRLRAWLGAR